MSLYDNANKALQATAESARKVNARLEEYLKSVEKGRSVAVRREAAVILTEVTKRSPVDTGRFRSSWNPSFIALGTSPPQMPARKTLDAKQMAIGATEGSASITDLDDVTSVRMTSGVRYAPFIEAGVSKQAPNGVVRGVLDRRAEKLREAIEKIQTEGTK